MYYKKVICLTLCFRTSYFNDNQYPDEAKREEIANACNAVIQKPGGMFKHKLNKEDECMCKCLLSWPQTLLMSSAVIWLREEAFRSWEGHVSESLQLVCQQTEGN